MRQQLLFAFGVLACAGLAYAFRHAPAAGQTYAVVVGIADYEHGVPADKAKPDELSDLTYTQNDARFYHKFLQEKVGGKVPAQHITLLLNSEASAERIRQAVDYQFAKAGPNDRVIFFFTGHGYPGGFVAWDFDPQPRKGQYTGILPYEEVKALFKNSAAGERIFLADACFAGGAVRQQLAATGRDFDWNLRSGQQSLGWHYDAAAQMLIMLSAKGDQPSTEVGGPFGQGFFTYYLLKGMRGTADFDNNRIVSAAELYKYVRANVVNASQKVAEMNGEKLASPQTPMLYGNFDESFPMSWPAGR